MSQNTTLDVAAEVRAELGRQGRNRTWLASRLGVSEMWVSRHLNGKSQFSVEDLRRVAEALEVPITTFLSTPTDDEQVSA